MAKQACMCTFIGLLLVWSFLKNAAGLTQVMAECMWHLLFPAATLPPPACCTGRLHAAGAAQSQRSHNAQSQRSHRRLWDRRPGGRGSGALARNWSSSQRCRVELLRGRSVKYFRVRPHFSYIWRWHVMKTWPQSENKRNVAV